MPPDSRDLLRHSVSMHTDRSKFFKAARAIALDLPSNRKAAVGANTLSDFGDASGQSMVEAFIGTIRHRNLLDALAVFARPIPVGVRRVLVASGAIASATEEAAAKAVTKLNLNLSDSDWRKVAAIVVISDELAKSEDPAARRLFESELETAVINASNTAVLDTMTITNIPTTGDVQTDLEAALAACDDSVGYVAGMRPEDVRVLALRFPDSGLHVHRGGELVPGVRIVGVPDLPITVIPASRFSLRDFGLRLKRSQHATLEMDTEPTGDSDTPTETQLVSMFQTNSLALLAERRFRIFGDSNAIQIEEASG